MTDSTHDLSAKVIDNTVSAILKFRDQLDVNSIDRAIEILRRAKRVEFYAMGNSRVVALDGQHKFFRFRIPASSYGDSHLFALAAELLGPGDVVIAISTTGQLPELLSAVDTARAHPAAAPHRHHGGRHLAGAGRGRSRRRRQRAPAPAHLPPRHLRRRSSWIKRCCRKALQNGAFRIGGHHDAPGRHQAHGDHGHPHHAVRIRI
jgi:glucokinase